MLSKEKSRKKLNTLEQLEFKKLKLEEIISSSQMALEEVESEIKRRKDEEILQLIDNEGLSISQLKEILKKSKTVVETAEKEGQKGSEITL